MKKPKRIFIIRRSSNGAKQTLLFTDSSKALSQYRDWSDLYGNLPDCEVDILIYKLIEL